VHLPPGLQTTGKGIAKKIDVVIAYGEETLKAVK
jgi:hypothetical protein